MTPRGASTAQSTSLWIVAGLAMGPAIALGLARFAYALLLPAMRADLIDENGAKVVDVGQRGSGDHRVSERLEESMRIIVRKHVLGSQSQRTGACQRVGAHIGPGDFLLPIDAVGVAGQRVYARMFLQGNGKRE